MKETKRQQQAEEIEKYDPNSDPSISFRRWAKHCLLLGLITRQLRAQVFETYGPIKWELMVVVTREIVAVEVDEAALEVVVEVGGRRLAVPLMQDSSDSEESEAW